MVPLWGQPETCTLGISRSDIDLSSDSNGVKGITISPTAIFMGSIISTSDEQYVKKNCKPKLKSGSLCDLTTGPGEILAIRQTIFKDSMGRPILETVDLEQGGKVIDENGTWLVDVPMNLDYVTTNEFGERVLSNDPKIGIPTKSKYRFKVKWNQSPSLSEPTKRGYFLVPNIREHGWDNGNPFNTTNTSFYDRAVQSYAFSLNWDDYGTLLDQNNQPDLIGIQMIQDAIDCKDTFYLMQYNKVYTVSQMIDQYRQGFLPGRFTGIKDILNTECSSDTNKFPTNDTVFRFDIIFLLFYIALFLFRPILITLIPTVHILAFSLWLIGLVLSIVVIVVTFVVLVLLVIVQFILYAICALSFGSYCKSVDFNGVVDGAKSIVDFLLNAWRNLLNIKIPNLVYNEPGDCNLCDCGESNSLNTTPSSSDSGVDVDTVQNSISESGGNSLLSQFELSVFYNIPKKNPDGSLNPNYSDDKHFESLMGGYPLGNTLNDNLTERSRVPQFIPYTPNGTSNTDTHYFTSSLPLFERLNLFNTKAKYFNSDPINNPGGGVNRIKVSFAENLPTNNGKYHYDNVVTLICQPNALSTLTPGSIITFQDLNLSKDINIKGTPGINNQFGTSSITGTPINTSFNNILPAPITADTSLITANLSTYKQNLYNQIIPSQISVDYAKFDGSGNNTVSYDIIQGLGVKVKKLPKIPNQPQQSEVSIVYTGTCNYAKFPMDVEYFQVLTAMTYSDYYQQVNQSLISPIWNKDSLFNRFIDNTMLFYTITSNGTFWGWNYPGHCPDNLPIPIKPIDYYNKNNNQIITFLVRGVDPNSERVNSSYDLSVLFGYDFNNGPIINGNFKLNQPIKGSYKNVKHNNIINNNTTDPYSNSDLFYDSFSFSPTNGGQFGFTGFNSNLISYYSNLDGDNLFFKPSLDSNYHLYDAGVINNNLLKIKPYFGNSLTNSNPNFNTGNSNTTLNSWGSNGFISEWKYNYYLWNASECAVYALNPKTNTQINYSGSTPVRGYYNNEIIDGGSLMFQDIKGFYYVDVNQDGKPYLQDSIMGTYFSPKYDNSVSVNFVNSNKIVMRSDRLPTSTTLQNNLNNSFLLHSNSNFAMFKISDNGLETSANGTLGGNQGLGNNGVNTDLISGATNPIPTTINQVLESFQCENMAPLGCYYNDNNGELKIRDKSDSCWVAPGGHIDFENGCYVLITTMFLSLVRDIELIVEWSSRIQITFGACRDVWSHLYTNNWINGTLYAFSFKNYITYDNNNQPRHTYCDDVIFLHPTTNNFYYRSSPFNDNNYSFPGASYYNHNGNTNNLLFPTTIMDMGPRNDYMQEIVMSDDYDGYIMNKMNSTTYGDVNELLMLFIMSRLTRTSFLEELIGTQGASIFSYFSRANLFGDGDYSQSISINSEIGVAPFEVNNYLDLGTVNVYNSMSGTFSPFNLQDPIYVTPNGDSNDVVFGVFFNSDTQIRDYISPKRTIINSETSLGNLTCAFNTFSVFSQEVPFYQWNLVSNGDTPNIFGGQQNEWQTNGNGGFFSFNYQELDRISPLSTYFRTNNTTHLSNFKGYIYSVSGPLIISAGTTNTGQPILNSIMNFNPNTSGAATQPDTDILTGAPFHFYFGLKIGKSAFDRFATKWLDTETTIY